MVVLDLVLLLSMIVSISGQSKTSRKHFCEALEMNDNKIDYTLNIPQRKKFDNYIVISGLVWKIQYEASPMTGSNSSALSNQKVVRFIRDVGYKLVTPEFLDRNYSCAFGVKYRDDTTIHFMAGVTLDYKRVFTMRDPIKEEPKSTTYIIPEMSSDGTTVQVRDLKFVQEINITFNRINFKPQTAFNTMSNIDNFAVIFIETQTDDKTNDRYRSRIQVYSIPDIENEDWYNQTLNEPRKVPKPIPDIASKYFIKGVFPIEMTDSNNGSIILIEMCSFNSIPCNRTVSYHYCIVADNEINATEEGKPCHSNNLKLVYDCSKWKISSIPVQDITETEESSKPEVTTPSPAENERAWSSVLILVIIVVILIIILLSVIFYCSRIKAKNAEESGATGTGGESAPKTPSTLSTVSARSKDDTSVAVKPSPIASPSKMSTISTRTN